MRRTQQVVDVFDVVCSKKECGLALGLSEHHLGFQDRDGVKYVWHLECAPQRLVQIHMEHLVGQVDTSVG